jgi:hypothetical protein
MVPMRLATARGAGACWFCWSVGAAKQAGTKWKHAALAALNAIVRSWLVVVLIVFLHYSIYMVGALNRDDLQSFTSR